MNSITKLHVLFFFVFIFYAVSCTAKLEKQSYYKKVKCGKI